jgi:hypothetical protein
VSFIKIPWSPRLANPLWLQDLKMRVKGLIRDKPGTWVEHTFWGPRHRFSVSFNEVRQRALFPMYFQHRDRVIHLADEPAQIIAEFADSDHLKIDELYPQSAKRQLSESRAKTETVSLYLDRSEGLTPQTLTVQFGYFRGLQSWAPVLIPALFFLPPGAWRERSRRACTSAPGRARRRYASMASFFHAKRWGSSCPGRRPTTRW